MKRENPCYGCKDREIGCHGYCEKYRSWNEHHTAMLEKQRKERDGENTATAYSIDFWTDRKKKRRGK